MKRNALVVVSVVTMSLLSTAAFAQTKFRVPLSLLDTQCANGKCYPTAYYDTNRSGSWMRDWACNAKTYNQHDGVDLGVGGFPGMDAGKWVMSAAAGTVIEVHDGEFDRCTSGHCGVANYIKIRHVDGTETWYWHLKKWSILVKKGQWVPCGVYIAKVGSSGYTTGPHLHFGVKRAGWMQDPYGATSSTCGRVGSMWTSQGAWGKLPGNVCQ